MSVDVEALTREIAAAIHAVLYAKRIDVSAAPLSERCADAVLNCLVPLLDRLKAAEAVVDVATRHHPTNCPASQHSSGRQRWHYCSDDQCKNPTHDRLVDCYRADWHDMDDALAAHSVAVVARGVQP